MQIPQVVTLFGRQMSVYTLVLGSAICVVIALLVLRAPRGQRRAMLDLCIVGLLGGLLLARAEHVLLRWDYYADHLDQGLDIRRGGLGWHGALLGAWAGMWGYLRLTSLPRNRTSPPSPLSARGEGEPEASSTALEVPSPGRRPSAGLRGRGFRGEVIPYTLLAFALPWIAAAAWVGCAAAGCAYGAEVRTLADYPPGVTAELRDVYGIAAPRWNTPLYGVVLAGMMVGVVGGMMWVGMRRTRHASSLQSGAHTGAPLHGSRLIAPRTLHHAQTIDDSPAPLRRTPHLAPRTFYVALAILAFGMFVIGYARGDTVVHVAGLRGDQALDAVTLTVALTMVIVRRRVLG